MTDMSTRDSILQILSDGHVHTGTDIGGALGISRAAVSKAVRGLEQNGVEILRVHGRGYRLPAPLVLLDAARIRAQLRTDPPLAVEVHAALDSTNDALLQRAPAAHAVAIFAERQAAGRGRRGRRWLATPYRNLLFSLAWRFEFGASALSGLSLAVGVALVEALREFGVADVGVKWPNDILWQERKLAGVLVDMRGEANGPTLAVIGVGINVEQDNATARAVDQPWIDLRQILAGAPLDRNRLAALALSHIAAALAQFARDEIAPFLARWDAYHVYAGRSVRVTRGDDTIDGEVLGVTAQGALLLRDRDGRERVFHAGEISVRTAA